MATYYIDPVWPYGTLSNGIWPIILPSQGHGFPATASNPQALHAHGGAVPDGPESAGGALTGSERGSSPGKNGGIQHDLTGKHGIYLGK
jgi:hypothetical protein